MNEGLVGGSCELPCESQLKSTVICMYMYMFTVQHMFNSQQQ